MAIQIPIDVPDEQVLIAIKQVLDKKGLQVVVKDDKHWRWLNAAHAAKYLDVSPSTLNRLVNSGTIPYSNLGPTTKRYSEYELYKYMKEKEEKMR